MQGHSARPGIPRDIPGSIWGYPSAAQVNPGISRYIPGTSRDIPGKSRYIPWQVPREKSKEFSGVRKINFCLQRSPSLLSHIVGRGYRGVWGYRGEGEGVSRVPRVFSGGYRGWPFQKKDGGGVTRKKFFGVLPGYFTGDTGVAFLEGYVHPKVSATTFAISERFSMHHLHHPRRHPRFLHR